VKGIIMISPFVWLALGAATLLAAWDLAWPLGAKARTR
jgi:hypothetical protein